MAMRRRFSCLPQRIGRVVKSRVFVAAVLVAWPLVSFAQQPRTTRPDGSSAVAQLEQTLVATIARAEPSVVAISRSASRQKPDRGAGDDFRDLRENASDTNAPAIVSAGVIIDRAGLVLTDYRAVHQGDQHSVTTIDRITYAATIRAADPRSGLAILAIDTKASPLQRTGSPARNTTPSSFPAIRIGDADTLRKGQFVVAIGNPYAIQSDGQPTASWGIVTNLARKAPPGANLNDTPSPEGDYRTTIHHLGTLIQTDAKLGFSAPGGALINLRGDLVGLTTTTATIAGHEQPAGYAIPMNAPIRRIIDTLKQGREVEYGMLGVGFGLPALSSVTGGGSRLTVVKVYPGSPAAKAGLQEGDIVTQVAGRPVGDVDAVQLAISTMAPSSTATIGYLRGGQPSTANVTLAKLAVTGKKIVTVLPDAWCGIRVDYATALDAAELNDAIATGAFDPKGCVLVADVEKGSVAWNAGVRTGMFISHVGGKRVATPTEFETATRAIGDKLDIRLTQPDVREHEKRLP